MATAEVTVFEDAGANVMALTTTVPSVTGAPRISTAVPFVIPVFTAIPRMAEPS